MLRHTIICALLGTLIGCSSTNTVTGTDEVSPATDTTTVSLQVYCIGEPAGVALILYAYDEHNTVTRSDYAIHGDTLITGEYVALRGMEYGWFGLLDNGSASGFGTLKVPADTLILSR
jgi:hypothetical protein